MGTSYFVKNDQPFFMSSKAYRCARAKIIRNTVFARNAKAAYDPEFAAIIP
jgi:hypothetical protein